MIKTWQEWRAPPTELSPGAGRQDAHGAFGQMPQGDVGWDPQLPAPGGVRRPWAPLPGSPTQSLGQRVRCMEGQPEPGWEQEGQREARCKAKPGNPDNTGNILHSLSSPAHRPPVDGLTLVLWVPPVPRTPRTSEVYSRHDLHYSAELFTLICWRLS